MRLDEYSDDDDPGYRRQDIRGQEAFIARELDLSDDEASHQGPADFHSPSRTLIDADDSSARDSSYMAEPAGTSAYGSEALSDQSHSTTQPDHAGRQVDQQLSITLKPDLGNVSRSEQDVAHLVPLDTERSDQSAESLASLTITDRSRAEPDEHVTTTSATENTAGSESGTSLVHQQSGFRHLLDGMLEKVSDAFGRHSPRLGGLAGEGSDHSDGSLSEGGDIGADGGMPTLRTHQRCITIP